MNELATRLARPLLRAAIFVAVQVLVSCSTTPQIQGLPDKLPDIDLSGSSATPEHHMASYEYPFDSSGNYVAEWAAEGERRSGRSASATNDDENKWSGSHGGRSLGTSSKSKGKTASSTKSGSKKSSDDDDKKSSSKPSGGTVKHKVKPTDNLYSIARKYGTTAAKIMKANGLKNDVIRDGAILTIPK